AELRELGTGLFLDRPLAVGKALTEPDQTPLLSYELFSPAIAAGRLHYLADRLQVLPATMLEASLNRLREEPLNWGLPLAALQLATRPGAIVSLADALRASDDFLCVRTTARSIREFMSLLEMTCREGHGALPCFNGWEPAVILGISAKKK